MRLPSLSVKLRTQPTCDDASLASMRLVSTTSCHWSWLLKSRNTAQTRSIGASMTVDLTTFCSMSICLQQPAGLARLASYFHLRPQMKVAKAKGLNTI